MADHRAQSGSPKASNECSRPGPVRLAIRGGASREGHSEESAGNDFDQSPDLHKVSFDG